MRRVVVALVLAGSLAVMAALFVLLRSITRESSAPAPEAASTRSNTGGEPAPAVTVRSPEPSRGPQAQRAQGGRPQPASSDSRVRTDTPTLAEEPAPPGTRLNTKNLHFGLQQLREKIAANAPQVAACVGDGRPTGNATLTFILAQRGDEIVVEQTDVDRDASSLTDEALLECLHKAASTMKFDGLPREAAAIVVTRSLALQDGAIADDKPVKFSYIR